MDIQFVKFTTLFMITGIFLATVAILPDGKMPETDAMLIPALQLPPTPTPRPNCSVPPYPSAAYDQQPYPTEIVSYFDKAGLNRLGSNGPSLPIMDGQSSYVPCVLLKAMGYQETGWKHYDTSFGNYGYTEVGWSCDYGLMQIVTGMDGTGDFDANRTNAEIPYSIGTGTQVAIKKWNALKLEDGGFVGGAYIVGDGNPKVVEDWYYTVWAYNSWGWTNNPNNNCDIWSPGCGGWYEDRPPFDPYDSTQNKLWYPYQELIWGYAIHPPMYNGVLFWQATDLTLPSRTDVGGSEFSPYPNKELPRPEPHHGSCSANYLPIIRKDPTPTLTPTPTVTPTPLPTATSTPNPCVEGQDLIVNGSLEQDIGEWSPWVEVRDPETNYRLFANAAEAYTRTGRTSNTIWLGGQNRAKEEIYQTMTLPDGVVGADTTFWIYVTTAETSTQIAYDVLSWDLKDNEGNSILTHPITISNLYSKKNRWAVFPIQVTLAPTQGRELRFSLSDRTDWSLITHFFIDNVQFKVHCP